MKQFTCCRSGVRLLVPILLGLLAWMEPVNGQSVTWQALPFPVNSSWPGPFGQPASITSTQVVLYGQPVRSEQTYSGPLTLSCNVTLTQDIVGQGDFLLALIPPGQAANSNLTSGIEFVMAYGNPGPDSNVLQMLSFSSPGLLWSDVFTNFAVGATYHLSISVATNGVLSLSVNGLPYLLPSSTTLPFSQFQIQMQGWQPSATWTVSSFTVSTPTVLTCPSIVGTWTGQVNVVDSRTGYGQSTLTLQVTDQTTNSCLLRGYLNNGSTYNRGPWGCFSLGGLWGNVPFTGAILDTTGVILNFGIFGQASATLDLTQTPPVMTKFLLLSTGGTANGDTAVGDLTEEPSTP